VDETHVKVAGRSVYMYRAVDQFGQVIDVYASARRDSDAARRLASHALLVDGHRLAVRPFDSGVVIGVTRMVGRCG
jgi:transposase-like protein